MLKQFDGPKAAFYASTCALVFAYGVAVGNYRIFPFKQIQFARQSVSLLFDEAPTLSGTKPTHHLTPARYDGEGAVTLDEASTTPGVTLVNSFFDGGLELRLIDADGSPVNRWPLSGSGIWGDYDHVVPPEARPATDWNVGSMGSLILPDGSVVVNVLGLVKIDRCGSVEWSLRRTTHHSVEPSSDGGFWVGGRRYLDVQSGHPPIAVPYIEDTILKVSADGVVLQELSVLDLLIRNGLRALLFSNNREFDPNPERDVIHLNDINELTEDLAPFFPEFEVGDLLVSIREPNMVFVLDPETGVIRWHQVGPWIQQHDADFQIDGTIAIFDNQYDGTEDGSIFGGSRIVKVRPDDGSTAVLYGGREDQPMYTSTRGHQQTLGNGNILITESNAGRVIEVDRDGRIVWEFVNRYSDDEVLNISEAKRYDESYFEASALTCTEGSTQ